jgi:hypothetical protein
MEAFMEVKQYLPGFFKKNNCRMIQPHIIAVLICSLFLLNACASIPVENRPQVRTKLVNVADEVLAGFIAEDPAIETVLQDAKGYFVGDASMGMYGLLGFGGSIGVLYDKQENTTTYIDINSIDLGLGVAGSDFQMLVLFKTVEAMEKIEEGIVTLGPSAASMAGPYGGIASLEREGWTVYVRSKSGFALGGSLALTNMEINTELTDVGVSEIGIPNIGLANQDSQGEMAPRKWNRTLPFLGQKVIDKGYNLPLPLGVGLTAAFINQEMDLTNLSAGVNGRPMRGFESVSFNKPKSETQSLQVKLDAWLFPFMNVFAMAGGVKGDFDMDVGLDGNTMLSNLEITCPTLNPIDQAFCNQLEDQTFILPIKTEVDIFTYGVGTTLAGGWNNWFLVLPMSVNWAEPENKVSDGVSYTVTPRFGRVVNLRKRGSISAFGGGNWLRSKYTITGNFVVPDQYQPLETIEYSIDQESRDNWTLLVGFNWDFNRRTSWSFEYNGFIGSRESVISSLNFRF